MTSGTLAGSQGHFARWLRALIGEIPGVLILVTVVSLWTLIVEDLGFWDEASYMRIGMDGGGGGFTGGAVYSDIYWMLSAAIHDPVNLYFAGRMFAASVFVLAVWAAIRIHAPARIAWSLAAVAAVLPVAHVWPGVANPAAAILLVCVSAVFRWPTSTTLCLSSGALWVAAGARPEFVYLALVITLWSVAWVGIRSFREGFLRVLRSWIALGISFAVLILLVVKHGSPFDNSRSWVAFGQHYGIRTHLPGEDNWYQWEAIMQRDFPGASSVGQALTTSPTLFAKHVLGNIIEAPGDFVSFLAPDFPLEHPARLLATVMLLALTASALGILALQPRATAARLRGVVAPSFMRTRAVPISYLAAALVFLIAPLIAIYPREHYLLALVGFLFLAYGLIISRCATPRARFISVIGPQTLMFAMFAVLTLIGIAGRVSSPPTFATTVRAIDATAVERNFLAVPSELANYTDLLTPVNPQPVTGETFVDFLLRNDINAVLVTERLTIGPWSALPGLREFIADPESAGYRPIVSDSQVFIRGGASQ